MSGTGGSSTPPRTSTMLPTCRAGTQGTPGRWRHQPPPGRGYRVVPGTPGSCAPPAPAAPANRQVHASGTHVGVEHASEPAVIQPPLRAEPASPRADRHRREFSPQPQAVEPAARNSATTTAPIPLTVISIAVSFQDAGDTTDASHAPER